MKFWLTCGAASLCAASFAQFSDNFESETGSAAGTVITGQNGWYLPSVGGLDGNVYTYAGNALGLVNNPTGGSQFLGMQVTTSGGTHRAQHAVSFTDATETLAFDFNGNFNGTPPTVDNLGSVSLQNSATANYFQTIYQWGTNAATASAFNANIGHFAAAGGVGGAGIVFDSPGAAWTNLTLNHWYHQTVTWSFATGLIMDTSLRDITANGAVNDFQPTGWYLSGGANNVLAQPNPTDIRFFASGGAGDIMGYDNLSVPEPVSLVALSLGAVALLRRRRNRA